MLYVNALRGVDSTGIFYVNKDMDVQIHKDTAEAGPFIKSNEWERSERELISRGVAVVGHCRAATRGVKKDDNAHPFNVDNKIILVHNGTYLGDHKHLADTEVDSHAIAHVLAEESDIAKALNKINAAYALIWYNTETKTLHAIRNKERPLWYAEMENGAMAIASESSFIYLAAWRNGLKINKEGVVLFEEHQLLTVHLDDLSIPYEFQDIEAQYKPPVYVRPVTPLVSPQENQNGTHITSPQSLKNWRSTTRLTPLDGAEMCGLGEYSYADLQSDWRSFAPAGKQVVIESTDYCKVDDRDLHSKSYFVYGKIMSSDPMLDGMIAAWEIEAPSEKVVLDYTSDDFPYFDGKVEYGMLKHWVNREGQARCTAIFKMQSATRCSNIPAELFEAKSH